MVKYLKEQNRIHKVEVVINQSHGLFMETSYKKTKNKTKLYITKP